MDVGGSSPSVPTTVMKRVFTQSFVVVGAILEKDGKFLLVKESNRGLPDDGKWNQPAGWLDVGEDVVKAAKREVEEETGVSFTPKAVLGIYSLVRKDVEDFFKDTPHGIKIILKGEFTDVGSEVYDDISETRWFSHEEIYAMDNKTLRDVDIKRMVKDYQAGKSYPLELITHTLVK